MPSTSRAEDENPPGPLQLHVPPPDGCGPRLTVLPEATVTLFAACHAPQFTSRYGTIGVGAIMIVNTCVLVTPAGFV
jgi:hypothetical protein